MLLTITTWRNQAYRFPACNAGYLIENWHNDRLDTTLWRHQYLERHGVKMENTSKQDRPYPLNCHSSITDQPPSRFQDKKFAWYRGCVEFGSVTFWNRRTVNIAMVSRNFLMSILTSGIKDERKGEAKGLVLFSSMIDMLSLLQYGNMYTFSTGVVSWAAMHKGIDNMRGHCDSSGIMP